MLCYPFSHSVGTVATVSSRAASMIRAKSVDEGAAARSLAELQGGCRHFDSGAHVQTRAWWLTAVSAFRAGALHREVDIVIKQGWISTRSTCTYLPLCSWRSCASCGCAPAENWMLSWKPRFCVVDSTRIIFSKTEDVSACIPQRRHRCVLTCLLRCSCSPVSTTDWRSQSCVVLG